MGKPLRALIVEDSEDDALLVIRELERGGYDTTFERVETAEAMTAALEKQAWDIIICDYRLPHFSAPEALVLFQQSSLDLPFIVVSGTVGEEVAVLTMKAGGHDYLMKDNLTRLAPAVERELSEAQVRRQRRQAQQDLSERVKELRCLYEIAMITKRPAIALDEAYLEVTNLIPLAWRYPDITCARATIDGNEFMTPNFRETAWKQASDIIVDGQRIGAVEVFYLEEKPECDEGPFLKEERSLINNIARQLGDYIQRKRAEETLQESEERYRGIIENAHDMIQSVTLDGQFILVNPAWLQTLGYTEPELLDFNIFNIIHPESLAHCQELFAKVMRGESVQNIQATFIAKDGREVLVEGNAAPRYVGSNIVGAQGIFRDITERKRAEDKLRRAAKEWGTTFDSIIDLVSICDKDFKLVRVNKAFTDALKKKPKELIGKPCYEIVHGTKEPPPNCPHEVTIKTKKPAMAEFFEPHLGIHLEVATSPMFDKKGDVVASVHVLRDITERKKMQEQLIITDRLASIGELASGIAHELNNPLTSVIGFSELLLEKDVPDDVKEDLEIINKEAKRTALVVRNLLTFARKHPEEKELVNINGTIEKVLELRAYEQKVSNIKVDTRLASNLPETIANSFELQQVFLNIVINAEHFMIEAHKGGNLTITTERVEDIIRASFADDGPGIAKENLGHLFNPFFTTKEIGKGTGLGLSICHGIVTAHGGRIYAESKLGKGATFVVELPLLTPDTGGTQE